MDGSIVPERLVAWLSGLFGFLGAALMAIGLYDLLAYTVARRTHEIGIRMAIGAGRSSVARISTRWKPCAANELWGRLSSRRAGLRTGLFSHQSKPAGKPAGKPARRPDGGPTRPPGRSLLA
jgi:hypothetical protein